MTEQANAPQPHVDVRFFQPNDVGPRDWGREILVAHVPGKYTVKILKMNKGHKGGLQYHQIKDESAHLLSGKLLFRYDNGDGKISERVLLPGESVHIPPDAVHQEEALEDCVIIEGSNPIFNDRVRVEEKYGLEKKGGLPTTTKDEIKIG